MKKNLFLVFCVVACTSALQECTQEEYNLCDKKLDVAGMHVPPLTPEELDIFCRAYLRLLNCQIDLSTECPNAPFAKYLDYLNFMKTNIAVVCDKASSIRRKYLENALCFNDAVDGIVKSCLGPTDLLNPNDDDRCSKIRQSIKCIEDIIYGKCGQDALDVFIAVQNPEYQLKVAGCA